MGRIIIEEDKKDKTIPGRKNAAFPANPPIIFPCSSLFTAFELKVSMLL